MPFTPQPANAKVIRALLLGFAAVAPIISLALIRNHLLLALAPLFVSHMLALYATLAANCQWWGLVVRRFRTSEREVWITIDDGPSLEHTIKMLDILEQYEARATFFVIGERAEKYPHLITEILMRGHALANHTHTHPSGSFWCAGSKRIAQEIDRCAEILRTTPERPAQFFRAPAGLKNFFVHPVLERRGLVLLGWGARGLDGVGSDPLKVAKRIEKQVEPGAIVLLHEGKRTEKEADFSPRCLELTLQHLAARGYRFVVPSVEQLV